MRFHVESWAPEYGVPVEDAMTAATAEVDLTCELAPDEWRPIAPDAATTPSPACVAFVDGVRRVDARVWVTSNGTGGAAGTRQGICASYAAGAVRCDGKATIAAAIVQRGVFCAGEGVEPIVTRHGTWEARGAAGEQPEQLWLAVQGQMAVLEAQAAIAAGAGGDADLVVVDGPLRDRRHVPGVVGYVKTHHVHYLGPGLEEVIAGLTAGERTPVFHIGGAFPRWSWYVRLPSTMPLHPWSGIVRLEAPPNIDCDSAKRLADTVTTTLGRFASEAHKDPRAPQNLYPIAGLERELRRRLGDSHLLLRSLRAAAAS